MNLDLSLVFRIWLSVSCGSGRTKPATLPYFLFPENIRITKAREEKRKTRNINQTSYCGTVGVCRACGLTAWHYAIAAAAAAVTADDTMKTSEKSFIKCFWCSCCSCCRNQFVVLSVAQYPVTPMKLIIIMLSLHKKTISLHEIIRFAVYRHLWTTQSQSDMCTDFGKNFNIFHWISR